MSLHIAMLIAGTIPICGYWILQKLEYAYDRLPEKEQEKVQRYAESLLREIENQKYNQK